jgi:hypothetical protein
MGSPTKDAISIYQAIRVPEIRESMRSLTTRAL